MTAPPFKKLYVALVTFERDTDLFEILPSCSGGKCVQRPVWAVHDGNPGGAVIPIPATVWLFGSALEMLGWIRRKAA